MSTPANTDVETIFARFEMRMAAVALDLAVVILAADTVLDYLIESLDLNPFDRRLILIAALLLYFSSFWSSPLRATPGQLLFGMRVVNEQGEKLSLGRAFVRGILLIGTIITAMSIVPVSLKPFYIAIPVLGYTALILAVFTPNCQAGHDLLARSLVVKKIILTTPEFRSRLNEHNSAANPALPKQRRPAFLSTVSYMILLGIPVFVQLVFAQVHYERDLRSRVGYAFNEVHLLKAQVQEYYLDVGRWPESGGETGVGARVDYPDGGYYELEDNGVIRIRFEVKPELLKGTVVLAPTAENQAITWKCHADGDLSPAHLPAVCR